MSDLVCAVDVGTGSARSAIVDRTGKLLGRAEHPIAVNRPAPGHAEHDSEDIWSAVCEAVRAARERAGVAASDVAGISFDATCSLVVRGSAGEPISVSAGREARWDTIAWFDHRAVAEAEECLASGHQVVDFLGRAMSPEMQVPKLMWLKRHLPESWSRAAHIFDLADFLTFKASGSTARSQCTLACKWTYLAHEEEGWRPDFFAALQLEDLFERTGLPRKAALPGTDLGPLTPRAAQQLGLTMACRVGTGVIDAYAGALGVLGGLAGRSAPIERHLALIAGTSSCVMAMSREPRHFAGCWGPYFGAALPGVWLSEGGQSASGALLDHVVRWCGHGRTPDAETHRQIVGRITELRQVEGRDLASRLHVVPDFHGNRSPYADPHALGVVSGLTLDSSFDSLCRLYWRTAVAIALGIRHILDAVVAAGYQADRLHVAGGHTRNPLLMELYADATGWVTVEPETEDAVLLGTAMLAATAAGLYPDLHSAGAAMIRTGVERRPAPEARTRFDRDYRIFLEMHRHRQALDRM
ncbi:MAG TPA: FGGY-family carbohydrate kinase [Rhizobiaceae bacterium]|nr:FGGY-family carbohydrate kinase [Rhizobiaceae bacterium]